MEEQRPQAKDHTLILENRRRAKLTGVQEVLSFNENEILLMTREGKLQIRGSQLHVKSLDLEKGAAEIEGQLGSLIYLSSGGRGKEKKASLLKRMLQ